MANNQYNNKVELSDGTVLMDLTGDTVTPGDLLVGVTAHDRSGAAITGTQKGVIFYGTCSTTASTQAKTVTINGITEYYTGLNLRILFTKAQDYNGVPTLNVNSIGAVNIGRVSGTNAAQYEWGANEVLDLVYDGTRFVIVSSGITDRGTVTISSTDQIKSLTPGPYRIYRGDTDIFPHAYGVLVITKSSAYSTALFYPVNVSNAAAVYRKSWNNVDGTWYESIWKHDINASDLPLTVANGGTGLTSSPSMLTNLESTSAANVMDASPRPGVTGTLPAANGGTGETSLAKFAMNRGTTISSISSDTALLDYDTGFYKISLSAASSYIPTRYGILELIKADNYGVAKYTAISSSAGHYWIRAFHATNKTWYDTSWLQIL